MVKIMIDAGHDINTPGKRALDGSMKEFEFNSMAAHYVVQELGKYENVEISFSHNFLDGIDQSLKERVNAANQQNVDVFLSIHANAGPTSAHGIETYIHNNAPQRTLTLAKLVHENTIRTTSMNDRGVRRADFQVLRETKMEAVLIECGFMTNTSDLAKLKDDGYRRKVGVGIVNGLAQFYGLKLKPVAAPAPQPTPTAPSNTIYRVQVGAFSNRENADRLAAELKAKGYSAVITQ